MEKKQIALVTGGYSGEAVISYQSAQTVYNSVDRERYDVFVIDIRKDGWWFDNARPGHDDMPMQAGPDSQAVDRTDFSIRIDGRKVRFDAALMCLHGAPGEDGKLPGYFDMIGLPYTSCGAATSALTFNKRYTVAVAAFAGISVARSIHLFRAARDPRTGGEILDKLRLPLFIKPNNGGSSIGMSKVARADDLEAALDKAFAEDDQVLAEEFISGREFTIGVYRKKGVVATLPITEIIPDSDFFDYEAKYHGKSREITPADAPEEAAGAVRAAAARIYALLDCRGVVRIDFIYSETEGRPYMLEVNTVPGQSAASLVPQQVRAAGLTLKEFYSDLLQEALP